MQDELRTTLADLTDTLVQTVKTLEGFWLTVGQPGLHRKVRGGQVQCRFVISHLGSGSFKFTGPIGPWPRQNQP